MKPAHFVDGVFGCVFYPSHVNFPMAGCLLRFRQRNGPRSVGKRDTRLESLTSSSRFEREVSKETHPEERDLRGNLRGGGGGEHGQPVMRKHKAKREILGTPAGE